jgi:hypothetical protein
MTSEIKRHFTFESFRSRENEIVIYRNLQLFSTFVEIGKGGISRHVIFSTINKG